jgi:hypothetical protein
MSKLTATDQEASLSALAGEGGGEGHKARVAQIESGIGTVQVTFDVFQHAGRFGIRLSSGEEKNSVRTCKQEPRQKE